MDSNRPAAAAPKCLDHDAPLMAEKNVEALVTTVETMFGLALAKATHACAARLEIIRVR